MDALELAKLIQEAIQEDVFVESDPTGEYDCSSLHCKDEEGNKFILKTHLIEENEDADLDLEYPLLDTDEVSEV